MLTVVGGSARALSLTEAASAVGLVPSTALRQLRSLEGAGLLSRGVDDQLYRPGPQLVALARTIFVGRSLPATAQPVLDELSSATGESVYLALGNDDGTIVYVATAPGQHALRHSGWLDRDFSGAGTAVGAALRGRVDADGATAREGKLEPGITAVSAPIRSADGIVAAINLVGPSFRLDGNALLDARAAVAAAAARLGEMLGHSRRSTSRAGG